MKDWDAFEICCGMIIATICLCFLIATVAAVV